LRKLVIHIPLVKQFPVESAKLHSDPYKRWKWQSNNYWCPVLFQYISSMVLH